MVEWVAIVLVVWLISAILSYALTLGYFDGEFPGPDNQGIALIVGVAALITGPVGFLMVLVLSGFGKHGLRFR